MFCPQLTRTKIDKTVKKFKNSESFILGLSPEGTRSRVKKWKTGFYHIALKANVPIVLVAMDYKHKTVGVIDSIFPTGDIDSDMRVIENHFKDLNGKISSNYNPRIM